MKLTESRLKQLIKEQMSEIEMSEIAGAVVFNTGSKALKDADDAGEFEEMIMDNSPDTGDIDEEALYDAVRAKIGLGALEELIKEEIEAVKEQISANSVMDQIITNQGTIIKLLRDVREFQTGVRPPDPKDLREQEEVSGRVLSTKVKGNVVIVTVVATAPESVKGKKAEGKHKFRGNINLAREIAQEKAFDNLEKGIFVD